MPKVGIFIPQQLLNTIDVYSYKNGYSRSELVRYALREIIKRKDEDEIQISRTLQSTEKTSA